MLAIPYVITAINLGMTAYEVYDLYQEIEAAGGDEAAAYLVLATRLLKWYREGGLLLAIAEQSIPAGKVIGKAAKDIAEALRDLGKSPYEQLSMGVAGGNPTLANMVDAKVQSSVAKGELPKGVAFATKGATGTVWDSIKATDPVYYGTDIPKSFELAAEGGNFWVHPNATEHMAEYFTRNGSSYSTSVETQSMLTSFRQAVNQAISQGIEYGQIMHVGDWELVFSQGRVDDVLPVIKHALRK